VLGLVACVGLLLVLGGCGGGDSGKAKPNPSPSPSLSPAPTPAPTPPPAKTPEVDAAAKAKAAPAVEPFDDHSDDPWYNEPTAKVSVKPSAAWEPDKALVDQLEPYQDIEGGYQIRLPKGFTATSVRTVSPGSDLDLWIGPPRADSHPATIQLFQVKTASPEVAKATLAATLTSAVGQLKDPKAKDGQWKQTPPETGQLGGLTCLRVRNEAVGADGKGLRGVSYAVPDASTQIMIHILCPAADADTLKLAEAAALTFRKK
jgi:hypothetical protein